jgi:uncharacterized delta-60 repeat protein
MRKLLHNAPLVLALTFSALLLPAITIVAITATGSENTFERTYGGTKYEEASSVQQTRDGGYVVAGYTNSFGAGSVDFWVLKLNSAGTVQWQKTYGGAGEDLAYSVEQTRDGGYVVAGYTSSFGVVGYDFWVLKLKSDGSIQWQKTYGGTEDDLAYSVQPTSDGGYVVAGYTYSFGAGGCNFWVLKLDSGGSVQWQKTYGGTGDDLAYSVQQTKDGGYVVAGYTRSFGAGGEDFWVLKLKSDGSIQWQKTYGGSLNDEAYSVEQTRDGGYVVAGYNPSFGAGGWDFWVLKLKSDGSIQWQKTYSGPGDDGALSVEQTSDGGYVVAGHTNSFGVVGYDFWVLKLKSDGSIQWQKTYGGTEDDYAYSVQQTKDGGYVVAGSTTSFGAGGYDFWVLKLDSDGSISSACGFGVSSPAIPAASTVTPAATRVTATTSTATVSSTSVTGTAATGVTLTVHC